MLARKDFFILLTRLLLGYIFISSGLCKVSLGYFGQVIGPPQLETVLAPYKLELFGTLIGITQVICGLLMFSQRFSTLGAIMLLPMNICILGVTVSMGWQGTPYVNVLFSILNILVLLYDWHKLKFLFSIDKIYALKTTALDGLNKNPYHILALVCGLLALLFAKVNPIFIACAGILCFSLICWSIVRSRLLNRIQQAVVVAATINMIMITIIGRFSPINDKLVGVNSVILFVLFVISLFRLAPKRIKESKLSGEMQSSR